jgi:hypothetical protein
MNNEQKKQYALQEALRMLEQGSSEAAVLQAYSQYTSELSELFATLHMLDDQTKLQPSEAFFQSVLEKMSLTPLNDSVTPATSVKSLHKFNFIKVTFASLALVLIIVGGVAYTHTTSSSVPASSAITSPDDSSNAALNQDMSNIDAQLNQLDSDSAAADQALNS